MIFVTSWDDGHPLDERLGDLLDRFGLRGTFFVPGRNREGRPVMAADALRRLDGRFEIGSHTRDHVPLVGLSRETCLRQIVEGKTGLEQQLGHAVPGFCYPRGKWNESVRDIVREAGCSYGRTVENFRLDIGSDRYSLPVTMQAYPHDKQVLLRNYMRHGRLIPRFWAFSAGLRSKDWLDFAGRLLDADLGETGVVHVWGHSWEIEEQGLWHKLEGLFAMVASRQPRLRTIGELITDALKSQRSANS